VSFLADGIRRKTPGGQGPTRLLAAVANLAGNELKKCRLIRFPAVQGRLLCEFGAGFSDTSRLAALCLVITPSVPTIRHPGQPPTQDSGDPKVGVHGGRKGCDANLLTPFFFCHVERLYPPSSVRAHSRGRSPTWRVAFSTDTSEQVLDARKVFGARRHLNIVVTRGRDAQEGFLRVLASLDQSLAIAYRDDAIEFRVQDQCR